MTVEELIDELMKYDLKCEVLLSQINESDLPFDKVVHDERRNKVILELY